MPDTDPPYTETAESVLAWHFCGATLRDSRPIPADGETLHHAGKLVMCERGLHASERIIDALKYAPGETVCRVRCGGEIVRDADKLICSERTILWRLDATQLLHGFARRCALDVTHLWAAPEIVLEYLRTGEEARRNAACNAAYAAAAAATAGRRRRPLSLI